MTYVNKCKRCEFIKEFYDARFKTDNPQYIVDIIKSMKCCILCINKELD